MSYKFYYITEPMKVNHILSTGLSCDRAGYIYIITSNWIREDIFGQEGYVCDLIAHDQLSMSSYSLIEIDSNGIQVEIEMDNRDFVTSYYHGRIRQNTIQPEFIRLDNYQGEIKKVNIEQIDKLRLSIQLGRRFELPTDKIKEMWENKLLPMDLPDISHDLNN